MLLWLFMRLKFNQYLSHATRKVFVAVFIGLLSGTGCGLQQTQAADESEHTTQTVGWIEEATILGVESEVEVKLDTGAETSSINAEVLEEPDKDTESGGMIKFRFLDGEGNNAVFERPIVRWVRIKARDGGSFRRPVVQMKFCIAGRWVEEEVNLAERDEFNYSVLIGRNMLSEAKLTVDSSQTFTTEATCPTEETQE